MHPTPNAAASLRLDPVDVLVFAPHPDDEVLGAGGMVQRSLESGKRVRIVFATNGDGYPQAASALTHNPIPSLREADYLGLAAARQHEAISADGILGVKAASLIFLAYPDSVLAEVYADAGGALVPSPTTGRTATYGSAVADYHSLAHGRPAPYTRAAALADFEEILVVSRAAQIYVTGPADQHPDHQATYELVRDAIAAVGYRGTVLGYIVHSGPGWPWPVGPTPGSPFQPRTIGTTAYPTGVPWPPPVRVLLTGAEAALKLQAIDANQSQMTAPIDRLYMESFVKSEEVFWILRPAR